MSIAGGTVRLSKGDPAPDFVLPDTEGNSVGLGGYRGRTLIVYFYPAAMTPGCTKQAVDFRDRRSLLGDAGVDVVGISPDKPEKLIRFRRAEQLTFPLLSDSDRTTLSAYGAYGPKSLYGKTVTGVIRSTFVIDPHGIITAASYHVKATGHVARLVRELGIG